MNFFTKLSTLALVTFCVGATTAHAQELAITEIGSNITSTDVLQGGTQVAFYNTGRSLYVYNTEAGKYEMGSTPTLATASNMSYCWTVEKLENGKFKFKDNANKYVPVLGSGAAVNGNVNGDEFTITASNGKWLIQGTDNNYFNGNGAGDGFCGWGAAGGNSLYEIRLVTVEDLSTFTTYTITMKDASGETFGTKTVTSKAGKTVNVAASFRNATSATYGDQPVTVTNNTLTIPEGEGTELVVTYEDNLPFKTTEINDGEFVDATWYQMGVHNNQNRTYLQYNATDETIINLIKSNATNLSDDSQLWCFSGNLKDGFKIYNKAAGAGKSITYSIENGTSGNEHAIMADATAQAATWYLAVSSATEAELSNGFCFETKETTGNKYLNQRNTFLSYWSNNGNGSTFTINDVDEAALGAFNTALDKAKQYTIGSGIGEYQDPNGALATALAKAENNVPTNIADRITLTNELNAGINALVINQPATGKFYRFKSATQNNYIASNKVGADNRPLMTATPEEAVFYLTADSKLITSNMLAMDNYNVVANLGQATTFKASKAIIGAYAIRNNGGSYFAKATGEQIDRHGDENTGLATADCAWILEEVTDPAVQPKLTKTMTAEYATLAAPVALNIPAGVKAYTVTVDETKETAILNEVTEVIPAGVAVLLKKEGATSDFNFTYAPEGTTENENALVGVYVSTAVDGDVNAYILGNGDQGIGFYQMSADDRTLGANKAYLVLSAAAQAIRSITIGGPTTGIEDTVAEGAETEEYYDLQGRRVLNPTKGIYVTKSGKKVLFNK